MAREKMYASDAERQQAYRDRLNASQASLLPVPQQVREQLAKKVVPKRQSRPQRLKATIQELESLGTEYECWLEALPENLSAGELADQLQEAIEQLGEAVNLLETIELPRGFGR